MSDSEEENTSPEYTDDENNREDEEMDLPPTPPPPCIIQNTELDSVVENNGQEKSHTTNTVDHSDDDTTPKMYIKIGNSKLVTALDTCSSPNVLDLKTLENINSVLPNKNKIRWHKRNINLSVIDSNAVAHAKGRTQPITVSNGIHSTTASFLVMDLKGRPYNALLGISTMTELGLAISGIPSPTLLDGIESNKDDFESFEEDENSELNLNDHYGIGDFISDLLKKNETIKISDWCSLPNSEIDFTIDHEAIEKQFRRKLYRNFVSKAHEKATDETVGKWLSDDVTEINNESTPVNLPLLAVPQYNSDGSLNKVRICLDMRKINSLVKSDRIEFPSCSDLANEMAERTRKYFCFTWRGTQYRHKGAPFGLSFLPAFFHRLISNLFSDIPEVKTFLDDLIIATDTVEEHIRIARIKSFSWDIKSQKKEWKSIPLKGNDFLMEIDPFKRKRLLNIPLPRTGNDVASVLGAFNFVRDHLPSYGNLSGPLYKYIKVSNLHENKDWKESGEIQFKNLVDLLRSPIVLKPLLPDKPLHLQTDASETGYGGYIYQIDNIVILYCVCSQTFSLVSTR
eukprot:Awhi_evm1s7730